MNILLIVFILITGCAYAQQIGIEDYTDPDDTNADKILEEFCNYQKHPLNINSALKKQLEEFYFLPEFLIDTLINRRPFKHLDQVKEIIGPDMYEIIHPFICLTKPFRYSGYIRSLFRYAFSAGNPDFKKSPLSNKNILRLSVSENIHFGFLTQKDAGEQLLFDHWSAFFNWKIDPYNFEVNIGDFSLHHGEGLIVSSAFTLRKSASALAPFRHKKPNIRPALTANESNMYRGLICGFKPIDQLHLCFFYTHSLHDIRGVPVAVVRTDGYHRTDSENRFRDYLSVNGLGVRTRWNIYKDLYADYCVLYARYRPALIPYTGNEQRRNFFKFSGSQARNMSIAVNATYGQISGSVELASSDQKWQAFQCTGQFHQKEVRAALRFWYTPADFYAPFSSYSTKINNSWGYHIAIWQRISNRIRIDSYILCERTPWRTYFEPMPTLKNEFFLRLTYQISGGSFIRLHYQQKDRQKYYTGKAIFCTNRHNRYRIDIEKKISSNVRLRNRIEYQFIKYQFRGERGFNIFQDLYISVHKKLAVRFRFGSFSTESYASRIYETESDFPAVFASIPLAGYGNKWYIYVSWKFFKNGVFYFKYRMQPNTREHIYSCKQYMGCMLSLTY